MSDSHDIEENKDLAAFSYLWIMSVVVYFAKRRSPFIRFHSKQGMVLFGLSILVWFIPLFGRFFEILLLGLMVLGFLNAAQGLRKDLPIIGPLSRGEISIREAWRQFVSGIAGLFRGAKEPFEQESKETKESNEPKEIGKPPPLA